MDITLSDIAKYAYGNGFREGVKGGRGYLAVGTDGNISKICTHIGSSGKLDNLTNADFRILKEGSDRLVTILYNQAAQKLSGPALAEVRQKLHVDEKGQPLAVANDVPRTQQLIDRKLVASVVSLIDPSVWQARQDGKTIAEMAKTVSMKGIETDGTDMIADEKMKDALSGVEEALDQVAKRADPSYLKAGLGKFDPADVKRFVTAVKDIIRRDLSRLPKDGTMIDGRPTACRGEMARVVVPMFLKRLGEAVMTVPGMMKADLSQIDLVRAYKALPNVKENVKFTQQGVEVQIIDTAEKRNPIGALEKTLSEDTQKLLEHVVGVVIQNGTTLPGGKDLTFQDGYLYLARDVSHAQKHKKIPRQSPESKAQEPAPSTARAVEGAREGYGKTPPPNVPSMMDLIAKSGPAVKENVPSVQPKTSETVKKLSTERKPEKVDPNASSHVAEYRDVSTVEVDKLSDSAKSLRQQLLDMEVSPAEQKNEEDGKCLPVKYFDPDTGKDFMFDEYHQGGGDGNHCFFLSALRLLGLTPSNGNAKNLRELMWKDVNRFVNVVDISGVQSSLYKNSKGELTFHEMPFDELQTSFEEGVFDRNSKLPADASTGVILAHLLQRPVVIVTTETNRPNVASFQTYDCDYVIEDKFDGKDASPVYIHYSCERDPVSGRIKTGHFQAMEPRGFEMPGTLKEPRFQAISDHLLPQELKKHVRERMTRKLLAGLDAKAKAPQSREAHQAILARVESLLKDSETLARFRAEAMTGVTFPDRDSLQAKLMKYFD